MGLLLRALGQFCEEEPSTCGSDDLEAEVSAQLQVLLAAAREAEQAPSRIPTFFRPKNAQPTLQDAIRVEAIARAMQNRSEVVLQEAEIKQICALLEEYAVEEGGGLRINYDGFSQAATRCQELFGARVDPYFAASNFLRLRQDDMGAVAVSQVLQYMTLRSNMQRMRIQLSACDPEQKGALTEAQLEDFIRSMVPELPYLEGLTPAFLDHYCRITARKFIFFHGRPNGTLRIRDLANSHVLHEMLELRVPSQDEPALLSNWFSLQSAKRVHNTFLALDEDMSGMLSRREFSQISNGTMSQLFIGRIFEQHVLRQRGAGAAPGEHRDEMDLLAFADFVLAWDHRSHPAAIRYFFDLIDLQGAGRITPAELYTFFKEIHEMWCDMGEYAELSIYDVVDEIIDLVQPRAAPVITREDLRACGMSGIFFSILSDVKQFHEYNYREQNMAHSGGGGDSGDS